MAVSLLEGLLSADDFADEQAAISRGYREEPFSHACASRIFSSMEKRCRFSSRGTCKEGQALYPSPVSLALTGTARTQCCCLTSASCSSCACPCAFPEQAGACCADDVTDRCGARLMTEGLMAGGHTWSAGARCLTKVLMILDMSKAGSSSFSRTAGNA